MKSRTSLHTPPLFGVVLGGRLGYMLLYNFNDFIHRPWIIVQLWDGGMASHGGIAGLVFFTLYWARRHKISWTGIGDNLVVGAPIGLFTGRIANLSMVSFMAASPPSNGP
jgi:phosphatidylglycerol:prolipoprotein diacylglycerol transferase